MNNKQTNRNYMKIKIKRRWNLIPQSLNEPKEFYDIYHGFFSWFRTKWIIDKGGLTEDEVLEYLKPYIASGGVKIIIE